MPDDRPDADAIQAALETRDPPEATIKQLALDCEAPPDRVRYTVNQMAEWGVVDVDGKTVRLSGTAPEGVSDHPCPLGCGFRPETAHGAFAHLLAHALGRNSTGRDQRTAAE